jgi:TonB-linked SusC/RagA family outer membrane protein
MYDFDDRYLFTASIRQDGSSRFPENNRWGTFGAASVGWRISQEEFFSTVPLISNLKLRASYGVNGNDALPPNMAYIGGFNLNSSGDYLYQGIINTNANYVLGGGQDVIPGSIQTTLASENIRWESRYTTNLGFDLGLFDDRLTLSADYYISKTKDALVNPLIPLYLGNFGGNPFINLGELENRGFEFVLGYNENRGDFRYGVTANLTTIQNKVLALATEGQIITGGPHGGITRTEVGQPVGSFYLLQTDGIFQTPEEVNAHNFTGADGSTRLIQPYAKPGDVRYRDVNNDGEITDRDRSYVGSPIPKVQYGLNLTSGYRNFDLALFFQGVAGNKVWNGPRFWTDRMDDVGNFRSDLNPWTGPGSSNTTPRPLISGSPNADNAVAAAQNARADSDRWLESGSYLRLKNIQLGYTLPAGVLGNVKWLGSLRVYVTGQNVFTITSYTGLDPETVGSGFFARGVDDGSYPNLRTFTGGIQLGF